MYSSKVAILLVGRKVGLVMLFQSTVTRLWELLKLHGSYINKKLSVSEANHIDSRLYIPGLPLHVHKAWNRLVYTGLSRKENHQLL